MIVAMMMIQKKVPSQACRACIVACDIVANHPNPAFLCPICECQHVDVTVSLLVEQLVRPVFPIIKFLSEGN